LGDPQPLKNGQKGGGEKNKGGNDSEDEFRAFRLKPRMAKKERRRRRSAEEFVPEPNRESGE